MSLEEQFAKLTVGDESSIVEAVKADGVAKSGLAANIDALVAKCAAKDEAEALAGLATAKALAEGCPEAEAFTKECLAACLEQASAKAGSVKKAATETAMAISKNISPFAMKSLLPAIFSQLPVEKKWQTRELALNCISTFSETAPKQLKCSPRDRSRSHCLHVGHQETGQGRRDCSHEGISYCYWKQGY